MARARNIKPGFFKNEELGGLPFGARLLFIGLWTLADREGRLEDRPGRIAGELFPYDRDISIAEINSWLDGLANGPEAFIVRYAIGKSRFLQITNFKKHQSPHHKEQASSIPARLDPDENGANPVHASGMHDASTGPTPDDHQPGKCDARPDSLNPDSLNPDSLNPDCLNPAPRALRVTHPERMPQKTTRPTQDVPEWQHGPRFSAAWERYRKNRGRTETYQIVLQTLMSREIDWHELEQRHVPYCEYWDRTGWSYCGLTLLEWLDNAMPGPPPESDIQASKSREMVLCRGCNGRPCFCAEIAAEKSIKEADVTRH
jgi:hypothetical protein